MQNLPKVHDKALLGNYDVKTVSSFTGRSIIDLFAELAESVGGVIPHEGGEKEVILPSAVALVRNHPAGVDFLFREEQDTPGRILRVVLNGDGKVVQITDVRVVNFNDGSHITRELTVGDDELAQHPNCVVPTDFLVKPSEEEGVSLIIVTRTLGPDNSPVYQYQEMKPDGSYRFMSGYIISLGPIDNLAPEAPDDRRVEFEEKLEVAEEALGKYDPSLPEVVKFFS